MRWCSRISSLPLEVGYTRMIYSMPVQNQSLLSSYPILRSSRASLRGLPRATILLKRFAHGESCTPVASRSSPEKDLLRFNHECEIKGTDTCIDLLTVFCASVNLSVEIYQEKSHVFISFGIILWSRWLRTEAMEDYVAVLYNLYTCQSTCA